MATQTQWDKCSNIVPLKVKRVHHLSRTSTNVKRMVDFYTKVLGFKKLPRPSFMFDGAWLELGDFQIHIIQRNPEWNTYEDPFNNNGQPISYPRALTRYIPFISFLVYHH